MPQVRYLCVLNAPFVGEKKVENWAIFHGIRKNFFDMSRKRNAVNLKLKDFAGDPAAARNVGFCHRHNTFSTGYEFTAPATKIAKAQSEKYRARKK